MKRIHRHTIRKETYEYQIAAGHWTPCLEIVFRDRKGKHTHKISAGSSNVVHVYREDNETFFLSGNDPLSCVGLEVFERRREGGRCILAG